MYNASIELFNSLQDEHPNEAYMTVTPLIDYFNLLHPNVTILKTKQYVRLTPSVMYHRKFSCLIKAFNTQIKSYILAGFIDFWAKNYKTNDYNVKDQIEPKALSVKQFTGIIIVCLFLMFISVIIFVLELVSPYQKTIEKVMDFLTYSKK